MLLCLTGHEHDRNQSENNLVYFLIYLGENQPRPYHENYYLFNRPYVISFFRV